MQGDARHLFSGYLVPSFEVGRFARLCLAGCGSSSSQGLEGQMKEMNATREKTAKFAGTVTIDGKTPATPSRTACTSCSTIPRTPPTTMPPPQDDRRP